MAFEVEVSKYISEYVLGHLPPKAEMISKFDYIADPELLERVTSEYYIARYVYKFFEGMKASDELLEAEVRLQVIMYANVYEAIIHHLLFEVYQTHDEVQEILVVQAPIRINIPTAKLELLRKALSHDGKVIETYYTGPKKRDLTKIRFDEKAHAFFKMGFIDDSLRDELIEIYNLRNGIHLHAELRKDIAWDLDMSKKAYWRIEKFNDLVRKRIASL